MSCVLCLSISRTLELWQNLIKTFKKFIQPHLRMDEFDKTKQYIERIGGSLSYEVDSEKFIDLFNKSILENLPKPFFSNDIPIIKVLNTLDKEFEDYKIKQESYNRFQRVREVKIRSPHEYDVQELFNTLIKFPELVELTITNAKLKEIPEAVASLPHLKSIFLTGNELETFETLCDVSSLEFIALAKNMIKEVSEKITKLDKIHYLNLEHNLLTDIPESFQDMRTSSFFPKLNLSNNKFSYLPEAITRNDCFSNREQTKFLSLKMDDNNIREVPETIGDSSLSYFSLKKNKLSTLPKAVFQTPTLVGLNVSYNEITDLPNLPFNNKLSYLSIQGNKLTALPKSIHNLKNLKEIKIGFNPLVSLSEGLAELENLQKMVFSEDQIDMLRDQKSVLKEIFGTTTLYREQLMQLPSKWTFLNKKRNELVEDRGGEYTIHSEKGARDSDSFRDSNLSIISRSRLEL